MSDERREEQLEVVGICDWCGTDVTPPYVRNLGAVQSLRHETCELLWTQRELTTLRQAHERLKAENQRLEKAVTQMVRENRSLTTRYEQQLAALRSASKK
jgi:predicted RNase H-like nuclease (RuvC/YqgF family)